MKTHTAANREMPPLARMKGKTQNELINWDQKQKNPTNELLKWTTL